VIHETDKYIVFKTINPATSIHYLVAPKAHIQDLNSIQNSNGIEIIEEMKTLGKEAIENLILHRILFRMRDIAFTYHHSIPSIIYIFIQLQN
jgi:diadenosine tetraphosphate (Ap4A) HIT family hydrolase